jgi:hypothetical protein
VAQRLGYERIYFVGIDFTHEKYGTMRGGNLIDWLRNTHRYATEAGVEWISLSRDSLLNELVPCLA